MNKEEIALLAEKSQKGDKSAFGRLYELTGKAVYFNCLKLTGDEALAQDILQDTFVTALEKLNMLQAPENFQAWINRIAINKCKAHFAKAGSTEELCDETCENIPDDELLPEDYVENDAKRKIIMDIIDSTLNTAQRQTVILYYYNSMSVSVIANIMDCPEGTVLSRLNSARKKIREAVLIYEKENNDRLHAAAPIGILGRILVREEQKLTLPKMSFAQYAGASAGQEIKQININNAAQNAASTGGKGMLSTLKGKIIAGIIALIVVGGGVAAGVALTSDNDSKRDDDDDNKKISAEVDEDEDEDKDKNEKSDADDDEKSENQSSSKDEDDEKSEKEESEKSDEEDSKEDGSAEKQETDYEEFDGLEVFELITYTEERDGTDEISGRIVDAYNIASNANNNFLLLDDEGNIYFYYPEQTNPVSYSIRIMVENTSITKFDDVCFDIDQHNFVVRDGQTFYAKVCESSVWTDEEPNVIFEGEGVLFENMENIEIIQIDESGFDLQVMDSEGVWHTGHAYGEPAAEDVPVDTIGYFYDASDSFANVEHYGIEIVDMINAYYGLSDKGQVHEINVAADEDVVEGCEDLVFVDVFDNSTDVYYVSVLGLTDDNKIVAADESIGLLFEAECPEGTLENVWMTSQLMTVKTDTGYYTAEIPWRYDGSQQLTFSPCEALNNVADRVVTITCKGNVLLDNGCIYNYSKALN